MFLSNYCCPLLNQASTVAAAFFIHCVLSLTKCSWRAALRAGEIKVASRRLGDVQTRIPKQERWLDLMTGYFEPEENLLSALCSSLHQRKRRPKLLKGVGSFWWCYLYSAAMMVLMTWEWNVQVASSFNWPTGHPRFQHSLLCLRPMSSGAFCSFPITSWTVSQLLQDKSLYLVVFVSCGQECFWGISEARELFPTFSQTGGVQLKYLTYHFLCNTLTEQMDESWLTCRKVFIDWPVVHL